MAAAAGCLSSPLRQEGTGTGTTREPAAPSAAMRGVPAGQAGRGPARRPQEGEGRRRPSPSCARRRGWSGCWRRGGGGRRAAASAPWPGTARSGGGGPTLPITASTLVSSSPRAPLNVCCPASVRCTAGRGGGGSPLPPRPLGLAEVSPLSHPPSRRGTVLCGKTGNFLVDALLEGMLCPSPESLLGRRCWGCSASASWAQWPGGALGPQGQPWLGHPGFT